MINPALAVNATTLEDPNAMPGAQMPGQPPAIPSAAVPANVVLKMAEGTSQTSAGPTTSGVVVSPALKQTVADQSQAGKDIVTAQEQLKASSVANEQHDLKAAQDTARIAEEADKQREVARQLRDAERAKALAEWHAAQEASDKNAKMTTLWSDMSTPRRLLTSIGIGLGAAAASYNHGPNQAYEIYRDAENAHRHAEEIELQNSVRKAQAKGATVEQVLKMFKDKMEEIDHQEISKNSLIIKQAEALKKTNPTAAANADIIIAKAKEDRAKQEHDALLSLAPRETQPGTTTTTTTTVETTPAATALPPPYIPPTGGY